MEHDGHGNNKAGKVGIRQEVGKVKKKQWLVVLIVVLVVLLCVGAVVGLYIGLESGVIPNPHAFRVIEPLSAMC